MIHHGGLIYLCVKYRWVSEFLFGEHWKMSANAMTWSAVGWAATKDLSWHYYSKESTFIMHKPAVNVFPCLNHSFYFPTEHTCWDSDCWSLWSTLIFEDANVFVVVTFFSNISILTVTLKSFFTNCKRVLVNLHQMFFSFASILIDAIYTTLQECMVAVAAISAIPSHLLCSFGCTVTIPHIQQWWFVNMYITCFSKDLGQSDGRGQSGVSFPSVGLKLM